MRLVMLNGSPVSPENAFISVYDRGFLYGDSVFETVRTYGGAPFALSEHVARLERSASRVFIRLPMSADAIAQETRRAIELAANPESYARIMVTRGTGPLGLDPDLAESPTRIVLVEPLVTPPVAAYRDGISVVLVRTRRATDASEAAGAKVANYLASLLALREAKRAGASEALILDAGGRVLEGTTSNVFAVLDGRLVTPPESEGILPGITRQKLLEIAAAAGIDIELRPILEAELARASELFISSSIREILPVVRVEGRVVGDGAPGVLTRRIHSLFREKVGARGPLPWLLP